MQQPHPRRLFKARPSTFRSISCDIWLWRVASESLDRSVPHDQGTHCRLAIYSYRLRNPLVISSSRLANKRVKKNQQGCHDR